MVQRFSSREEAKQQAIERQRQLGVTAYRPKGYRYKNFDAAFSVMNRPKWMWTYKAPDVTQGTMVVMHTPRDSPKEYSVLGKYKDVWYTSIFLNPLICFTSDTNGSTPKPSMSVKGNERLTLSKHSAWRPPLR